MGNMVIIALALEDRRKYKEELKRIKEKKTDTYSPSKPLLKAEKIFENE